MADKKDFKAGDKVELAHKGTSFFDPQTRFEVTGEEKKELGNPIGKLTMRALVSGGLLVVGGGRMLGAGKKAAEKEGE